MRITTQAWETYIRRLAQLNEKAAQLMAEYLAAHGTADTEALTDYAAALVQKYGEGSAELACQFCDNVQTFTKDDLEGLLADMKKKI